MTATILIVEDNDKNLKLFKLLLDVSGYHTLTARDGEEALRAAAEALPDLILMDIQMPGMDGMTAIAALKADEKTRDIPVVALTSYAMKGDEERMRAAGFVHYISKPIQKDSFLREVERILRERMPRRNHA